MKSTINSLTGIRLEVPLSYRNQHTFDSNLQIVRFGDDNLHPNHLRDFYYTSPTLRCVVDREADFLLGSSIRTTLRKQDVRAVATDFALFNGFALLVHTSSGEIDYVQHLPFESVRLCEAGAGGITTQCRVVDWTFSSTVNRRRVTKSNIQTYWLFSRNRDVRLARETAGDGYSVLYYSLQGSYPISEADSVLTSISTELGLLNTSYRNVRNSFNPAAVISIPSCSDADYNAFTDNLKRLQGDANAQKLLVFQSSGNPEEKVEVKPLETANLDGAYKSTTEDVVFRIHQAFNQVGFLRLYEGGLGFANDAITSIYDLYGFQVKGKRDEMLDCLRCLDPQIEIEPLKFII